MALINVTRKPTSLQAYQLINVDDMIAALKYLVQRGYWGHINVDQSGTVTMGFRNATSDHNAALTNWIVIENATANSIGSVKALTDAQYQLMYQSA